MDELLYVVVYMVVIAVILGAVKKSAANKGANKGPGNKNVMTGPITGQTMAKPAKYDTYNKRGNASGAMPHKHKEKGVYDTYNKRHYASMADASKLPPGYILLNGEPVRVADLEGK